VSAQLLREAATHQVRLNAPLFNGLQHNVQVRNLSQQCISGQTLMIIGYR